MPSPNTQVAIRDHNLVKTIAGVYVQRIDADPAVTAGLAAAERARGVLISGDADAAALTDTAKTIALGIKALAAHKKKVLEVPKTMTMVVGEHEAPKLAALQAGQKACIDAQLAYKRQKDEEARVAQAQREIENNRLANEARAEAARNAEARALPGEKPEPELVVPLESPAAPERTGPVRGGTGTTVFSKVLKAALANVHDCPPEFLEFKPRAATDWLRSAMQTGSVIDGPSKETGQPVVINGVTFWYEDGASTR